MQSKIWLKEGTLALTSQAATAVSAGLRTVSPFHLQRQDRWWDGSVQLWREETCCGWTKLSSLSRNSQTGRVTRTADAVGQVGELLGVVQHFHTLGVGVVAHRERLRDGRRKFPVEQVDGNRKNKTAILFICFKAVLHESLPHFLFGIFEAVGNKVNRLVLCDGVLLEAGLVGVKGQDFGHVRQTILQKKKKKPAEKQRAAVCPHASILNLKQEVRYCWVNILHR